MTNKISVIKQIIKREDIEGIIQHGSTIQGVAGANSDYDYYVIVKNKVSTPVFAEKINNIKFHIQVVDQKSFEKEINDFVPKLMMALFDTNIIAGRLLQGKVILDKDNAIFNYLTSKRSELKLQVPRLIKKFRYQAIGFMEDSQHSNTLFQYICIEKAIDSLALGILIKNNFYNLNPKWQPIFLKDFLSKDLYDKYTRARFFLPNIESTEIQSTLVQLLNELTSEEEK